MHMCLFSFPLHTKNTWDNASDICPFFHNLYLFLNTPFKFNKGM